MHIHMNMHRWKRWTWWMLYCLGMWYECDDEHVDAVWCGLLPCMLVALMYMILSDECGHVC